MCKRIELSLTEMDATEKNIQMFAKLITQHIVPISIEFDMEDGDMELDIFLPDKTIIVIYPCTELIEACLQYNVPLFYAIYKDLYEQYEAKKKRQEGNKAT